MVKKTSIIDWAKKIGIAVGIFTLLSGAVTGWVAMELPTFASAMSVEKLGKGQANIGRSLSITNIERASRKRQELQWQLEDILAKKPINRSRVRTLERYIQDMDRKIQSLEHQQQKYEQRIIEFDK